MTPNQLARLLEKYGIRPIRDRGQNFLLDERVVRSMVDAAGLKAGELAVEIGPGAGILTAELISRGVHVAAVELDVKLCALLRAAISAPSFHLRRGDALAFKNAELVAFCPEARDGYAVIANLPYSITSAALEKFFFEAPKPRSVTVMVQREVADRILARPGDSNMLAIMAQTLGAPRKIADVPRSAFLPAPKVDSAVIHIELKNEPALRDFFGPVDAGRYFEIAAAGFSERRRQLKNNLLKLGLGADRLNRALIEAQINPRARAQELGPEDWRRLAAALVS